MPLHHKLIFLASAVMACVWTWMFYRIAFPRTGPRTPRKCSHHWHRIESYADGRAKARCRSCGKVAIVQVNHPTRRA